MQIDVIFINKLPLFTVPASKHGWSRIYGATFLKRQNIWIFPAFPPFLTNVLHDFPKVNKSCTFSEEATAWIEQVETQEKLPIQEPVVPSYDHQLQDTHTLLHNYRYILEWEMGTGKSKVIIDVVQQLKQRALILCPVVGLENWASEITLHSGGQLSTTIMKGDLKAKLRRMVDFQNNDSSFLVVSYGTVRNHAVPTLFAGTQKVFPPLIVPSDGLVYLLRKLNHAEDQKRLARDWVEHRPLKEIRAEVQEILQARGPQWLSDLDFDIIVADESHRIKNIRSQQTKAVLKISRKAVRRYLLTGTISQGDPRDLYPQLQFLAPYIVGTNWPKFCEKYVTFSPYHKHIVTGYRNLDELNRTMNTITSKKSLDECVDLPPQQELDIFFALSKPQIKDYNYAVNNAAMQFPGEDPVPLSAANRLNKLLQLCSGFIYKPKNTVICDTCERLITCVSAGTQPGTSNCTQQTGGREQLKYKENPKLKTLEDLLVDILANPKHKVIIWANFKTELDDIEKLLEARKWDYVRVDGSNSAHIKDYETSFQNDKNCVVYLGQIQTGIAITLTAAKYMVYYSRNWKLDDWLQSRKRNYRIGQTQKTIIYRLIARDTLEQQQLKALDLRQDISTTLTKKINCVVCDQFTICLKNNTEPWTNECILDKNVIRSTTRAKVMKE